ncbi:MAG: diaminopimelate decarboxylase, partial [Clostridia bacterium]|nr:diaminopimelate decarboxylase [Clostridia bacterium]
VDGGMTDNIRFALYGAEYTLLPCNNVEKERTMQCSVVGRCCESGDIIAENIRLPETIKRGDLLACLTTGAYHYSMASNYNRLPRPPIVMLRGGESTVAVRRETVQDVCALDE